MRTPRLAALAALTLLAAVPGTAYAALPQKRYTPIETALTAHATFASQPTEQLAGLAEEACQDLAGDDVLLDRYGTLCSARVAGDAALAILGDCEGSRACRRAVGDMGEAVTATVTAAKALNKAVPDAVPDTACRRALDVDGPEMRGLRSLRAALDALGRGLRDGSRTKVRAAEARLAKLRGIPSAEQNLGRLQRACRAEGTAPRRAGPPLRR